jgi:ribonuclease-3
MSEQPSTLHELEHRLGYEFRDRSHLIAALTHSSAVNLPPPRASERLEFLGDAVLGLVLSDLLVQRYPEHNEGQLSKFRASLVSTGSFAAKARELGLNEYLTLGKGEEKTGGREKASILAAVYEAVMGAVFVESGYVQVREVVAHHFRDGVEHVGERASNDAKTELQERCQQLLHTTPTYRVVEEIGPDHARRFVVDVLLGEVVLARGEGANKRSAEQDAAQHALQIPPEGLAPGVPSAG